MTTARRLACLAMLALAPLIAPTAARGDEADAGAPARDKLEGARLDGAIAEVAKARKDVKTLRASFTQERRITLLATSIKSQGTLTFAAPDKLRWDLAPPDDIVYLVGPDGLTYKTKSSSATAPANGAKVARALADVRALLAGDLGALQERYTLTASRSPADLEIAGTAKDKNASVKAFVLVLDKSLARPVRARLLEGKSDSIDLTFSNVVLNETVDPAVFRR